MLTHLIITDFAVVKSLELDFANGMSVITGETGAGKSIVLDALGLALGSRAEAHWVRPGCEKAEIAATFHISKIQGAVLWLADCELLNPDHNQECIIRRVLHKNGGSKAFINGKLATTSQLRLLGEYLVQIHGQHQHQLLLKPFEQLRLLDAFGQHDDLLSAVKKAHLACEKIKREITRLKEQVITDPSRVALLQYQVSELDALQLDEHEWALLSDEQKRLSHAHGDMSACEKASHVLEYDDTNALLAIQQAQTALEDLNDRYPPVQAVLELLKTAEIHVQEAVNDLGQFVDSIDLNPEKLKEVDDRLSLLFTIARKHKVEPQKLYEHNLKIKAELALLDDFENKLQQLHSDLETAEQSYKKVALKLSKARAQASKQLSLEVTRRLPPLGLKGAQFDIELLPFEEHCSASGLETIQFCVSTNIGHPLLALQKVVSGGELSRISLAIQLITAQYQHTPTLVFDEVDVGVGGKIGAIIGQALNELGTNVQVICITHLPQVAAQGDHHFLVSKHHGKQSTTTHIHLLNPKERIEEIARMLGGIDITQQALANAKALLKKRSEDLLES